MKATGLFLLLFIFFGSYFSYTFAQGVNVTRGPYLQIGTSSSMIIRWRTNTATDSKVEYGTDPANLNMTEVNSSIMTEHEVRINFLDPSTRYYYNIGSTASVQMQNGNLFFETSPVTGTKKPTRFWVIGDAGTGTNNQKAVRDAFYNYNGSSHVDGWLMLGDNAYENGTDAEYQTGVFQNTYESILQNSVLWPSPGNHDYANNPFNIGSTSLPYYQIFTLPSGGQAGGVASGTEAYYSFNYGNIHFICLDSYGSSRSATGAQAQWLQADLAATTSDWIVAYWHHPPYTKGSHNSDNPFPFIDGELPDIRQNLLPILEAGGVDLVLCGHSHSYERSYLLNGHYGNSGSLTNSMKLDGTSGRYPNSCPYRKNTINGRANKGTVYAVVGCSGKLSGTSSGWPHPAMVSSTNVLLGSMVVDVNDNRLDAKFVTSSGSVFDYFTIMKNVSRSFTYDICEGDSVLLNSTWRGSHLWSPGAENTDSIMAVPTISTVYYVNDTYNCLRDTFNVNILPNGTPPCIFTNLEANKQNGVSFEIAPNPVKSGTSFHLYYALRTDEFVQVEIWDLTGRKVYEHNMLLYSGDSKAEVFGNDLNSGVYFLKVITEKGVFGKKLMVD